MLTRDAIETSGPTEMPSAGRSVALPGTPVRRRRGAAGLRLGVGLWGGARVAAVATVPATAWWLGAELDLTLYAVAAVWVALTARRSGRPVAVAADVVLAVAYTFLLDGVVSPYLLFTMLAVSRAGMRWGPVPGAVAGGLVSGAEVVGIVQAGTLLALPPDVVLPVLTILPLAGVTASLAVRVFGNERSGRAVLQEANRLLTALQRVASDMPGGLDVATIAAASLAEIRTMVDPATVVVYSGRGGLLYPAASAGDIVPPKATSAGQVEAVVGTDDHRLLASVTLRGGLAATCSGRAFWLLVPLRSGGVMTGAFVVGHDELPALRRCVRPLVSLATDTALALDNARLFDGAATRAADAARRRIAHDLHDSVAQSLTHIKMELELLALDADNPERAEETSRLARVAERALTDVRTTITGLRSNATEGGLVEALRRHVEDLRGHGPTEVSFEASIDGDGEVDDELQPDILRIAQEAVSNAVRHASARHVVVALEIDDELVHLVIEDDGFGIPVRPRQQLDGGVGMTAMKERATTLGGRLTIRDRVGGGTVVSLQCPRQRRTERWGRPRRRHPVGR